MRSITTLRCCISFALYQRLSCPLYKQEALKISKAGLERCRQLGVDDNLLYLRHEHSKLLLLNSCYEEAVAYAEQLVAEKKINPEDGGCDLDCYQRVYSDALFYASSPQTAIDYLSEELSEHQESCTLWHTRASQHFRSGDYEVALSDCEAAILLEEHEDVLMLQAQALILTQRITAATATLSKLCLIEPKNTHYALWFSLISSDLSRLQRFVDSKKWERHIIRYLHREICLDTLIAFAEKEENPACSMGDVYAFAGLQCVMQGEKGKARALYQHCLEHSHFLRNAYIWSEASLKVI